MSCQNAQRLATNCIQSARTDGRRCFFGFIDAAKAFDSISHDVLDRTVKALGMHEDDARLLGNMLRIQNRRCFTARGLSTPKTCPRNGVAQGSSEGPSAFAWFLEPLLREIVCNHCHDGYSMGSCTVSVVAYADDLLLVSETREGLQRLFNVVGEFCQFSTFVTGRSPTTRYAPPLPLMLGIYTAWLHLLVLAGRILTPSSASSPLSQPGCQPSQEAAASSLMNKFAALAGKQQARVIRPGPDGIGIPEEVDSTKLVAGDIIELQFGDKTPADVSLIESSGIRLPTAETVPTLSSGCVLSL